MINCYQLRKDTVLTDEGTERETYGINVLDENGYVVQSIPDIFLRKEDADCLIHRCNQLNLSSIHIMDVIEDKLAQL